MLSPARGETLTGSKPQLYENMLRGVLTFMWMATGCQFHLGWVGENSHVNSPTLNFTTTDEPQAPLPCTTVVKRTFP